MNKKKITDLISLYEKIQFNEIVKWEEMTPGVVAQSLNFAMKPTGISRSFFSFRNSDGVYILAITYFLIPICRYYHCQN